MLDKLGGYRTGLYLSTVIALGTCVLWGVVLRERVGSDSAVITFCIISLIVPLGLWVQSKFVRYASAAFMVLVAGSLLWPILSRGIEQPMRNFPVLTLVFAVWAVLNLLTAAMLLFSKRFGAEFADERKRQPTYKRYFKWSLVGVVVGAMVIATANDIIRLASN